MPVRGHWWPWQSNLHWLKIVEQVVDWTRMSAFILLMKSCPRGADAFFPNWDKGTKCACEETGGFSGMEEAKPYYSEVKTKQEERKQVHSRAQTQYSYWDISGGISPTGKFLLGTLSCRTGRPVVLQSMGSQRARHDWGTENTTTLSFQKDFFTTEGRGESEERCQKEK